jgi:hypothetical protein
MIHADNRLEESHSSRIAFRIIRVWKQVSEFCGSYKQGFLNQQRREALSSA